jgi:hypothetical protein
VIRVVEGPLISQPLIWNLVFERKSLSWWSHLALGRYKHVRAYGYVPFLHVWQFVDIGLRGFDVFVAADGAPANAVIRTWIEHADVLRIAPRRDGVRRLPVLGWCVPAMRRLTGVPGGALRPDAFFAECLRNGATPFEAIDGRPEISTARA